MLESLPFCVLVGCILGFLSGLGVGGGSLLILWLTLIINMDHSTAKNINLMFFIPSAIISSLFRWKQGALDIPKLLPAILAGCISAAVFSFIGNNMDVSLLQKMFGILLIITGIRELLYKQKNKS